MEWQEVCSRKDLQDLPFKIELNKWGQIVMSPAKPKHSFYQGKILTLLARYMLTGEVMPELAIQTSDGVKVADVVWVSDARADLILEQEVAAIAPEICVEIKSASNTLAELEVKKDLYLAAQAEEVWLCDHAGKIIFYNQKGNLEKSLLVPEFPEQIYRSKQ